MSYVAEEFVHYRIANAPVREYPYPHIYVENVFPDDFYTALRANWPLLSEMTPLPDTGRVPKGVYEQRHVLPLELGKEVPLAEPRDLFWSAFTGWLNGPRFLTAMIDKFQSYAQAALGDELYRAAFKPDTLLVSDLTDYSIGPHTDAAHRFVTMLFYCPEDNSRQNLGTSIYVPVDPAFRCKGGPHYPSHRFHLVDTMPYRRNALFAFFKNDVSFHGVEPITESNVRRDLMLYDIRIIRPAPA